MLQMILFCACIIWMHGICEAENTLISCTSFQTSLDGMHSGKVSDAASKVQKMLMKHPLLLVHLSRSHLHTGMTSIEIAPASIVPLSLNVRIWNLRTYGISLPAFTRAFTSRSLEF